MLEHQPHTLHIIFGIAPVPEGVHIPQLQVILQSLCNAARSQRDLPGYKVFTPTFRFVVEEDPVDRKNPICFPILLGDPIPILLGNCVGRIGMERRSLPLRDLFHLSVEFRGGSLVEFCFVCQPQDPDSLQDSQYAQGVHITGILRNVKTDLYMALGSQVVDFVRLHHPDNPDQGGGIRQVTVVEGNSSHKVVDSACIGDRRTAGNPMNLVTLLQQKLRQIRAVLTGNASDECFLHSQFLQ